MAEVMSRLKEEIVSGSPRYTLKDKNDFGYSEWVPALADIVTASNIGDQKEALTKAIFGVATRYSGLRPATKSRLATAAPLSHYIEARFQVHTEHFGLTYVRLGDTAIGYQTPDEEQPSPAFAVVDYHPSEGDTSHRVVRDPSEPLTSIEAAFGFEAMAQLGLNLHNAYPGFEILRKVGAEVDLRNNQLPQPAP